MRQQDGDGAQHRLLAVSWLDADQLFAVPLEHDGEGVWLWPDARCRDPRSRSALSVVHGL